MSFEFKHRDTEFVNFLCLRISLYLNFHFYATHTCLCCRACQFGLQSQTAITPPIYGPDLSDCNFYNDYSAKERLSCKPFGQSAKIELVSFESEYVEMIDSIVHKDCCRTEIPKKDSKIDRSQLKEIITLSTTQIESLTNIFFNYNFGRAENGIGSPDPDVACYKPRHAILFFRKKADVEPFAYFEVCLECQYVKDLPKAIRTRKFLQRQIRFAVGIFPANGDNFGAGGRPSLKNRCR